MADGDTGCDERCRVGDGGHWNGEARLWRPANVNGGGGSVRRCGPGCGDEGLQPPRPCLPQPCPSSTCATGGVAP